MYLIPKEQWAAIVWHPARSSGQCFSQGHWQKNDHTTCFNGGGKSPEETPQKGPENHKVSFPEIYLTNISEIPSPSESLMFCEPRV